MRASGARGSRCGSLYTAVRRRATAVIASLAAGEGLMDDARARFDAEVIAAGLTLDAGDRERLFAMWLDHLPARDALRAAAPADEEEPWT
jgi:hypothetical protein